jgi:small-conductance mechanosensitive channel
MERWLIPLGIFVGVLLVGYGVRAWLYRVLTRWAERSATRLDDIIIQATKIPSLLWVLLIGALCSRQALELDTELGQALDRVLIAILILSLTLVAARLLTALIQHYSAQARAALPLTGLTQTFIQGLVLLIGVLILLGTLGINITPLLTALGIGGLAVALALQDTLSNLFAGLYILLAKQIFVGQRIKLESGEEGYVTDIGWRSTTLRAPANHLIIIPNAKLAQSIITNYDMPDPPVNIVVPVGVSYESDPRRVKQILYEEAQGLIRDIPGFVKDFDPIVRFQSFGDFSLNFVVIFRVEKYDTQFAVWDEIHQRIFARLRREGIEIPFPVRTVYLRNEQRRL